MSKSLSDMNISENTSNVLLNEMDYNFHIDCESINTLGSQYEENFPGIIDDFRRIQENVEEHSNQIREGISRTNGYSVDNSITVIENAEAIEDNNFGNLVFEESLEYESGFIPAKDFSIMLGTNEIPRFSCESHKNNIAVRLGIRKSSLLTNTLIALSRYASSVRISIIKSSSFIKKKVRLKIKLVGHRCFYC